MGLDGTSGLTFPSPYALEDNGLVYLPRDLPEPSDVGHTEAVLEAVTPLLDLTSGGVFCLFTSHRALNAAKKWFRTHKGRLVARKLLGTGSFWEGVDVRGSALTIVAIDKLPFASPADPLLMARLEFIRREGGNGFAEHQLPQAALAMKQGAGRLLRDETDYGVIVLCDPRIRSRNYGKTFLKILEPMPVTDSIDDLGCTEMAL